MVKWEITTEGETIMFTTNIEDFYNFAAGRIIHYNVDFVCNENDHNGGHYKGIAWTRAVEYAKDYCSNSIDEIKRQLQAVGNAKSADEKYNIYDDLYWYIFDEDDYPEDFKSTSAS